MKQKAAKQGLSVNDLGYSIEGKVIFKKLNLNLLEGETCLVFGKSGSGKTTLLSVLAGLQKPSQGTVNYGDSPLYDLSEAECDKFRGEHIGILFQTFHLIKTLTVRQNVLLTETLSDKNLDLGYVENILKRLQLADKAEQKVSTLSVGEAQRLALARAIAKKPKWLFCDEPTSSLDDENTKNTLSLIQDEAKRIGTSLIIVTHDNRVKQHFNANQTLELI